jgi:ATP-dependent Clp protease ATP-binding subunit ClpB
MAINFNKFTIKAQEALQAASEIASSYGNQQVDTEHLFAALVQHNEGTIVSLLKKIGADTDAIKIKLSSFIDKLPKVSSSTSTNQYLSQNLSRVLDESTKIASQLRDEYVSVEHIFIAISESDGELGRYLRELGINREEILTALKDIRGTQRVTGQSPEDTYQSLKKYGRDLNELARQGKLDPVIGREDEIRRVLQVLQRRTKNNPVLVGEPGVGKTAIAEGLAFRIVKGEVPEDLMTKTVVALDMGSLVAGTSFRGQFEERIKAVVNEVKNSEGEIILFIDELHTVVGAGAAEGAVDAANILKPALARGELHCIGATTLNEYRKYIEKDAALERRFQPVLIDEPTVEDTISILRGLKERYEVHHGVRITDSAIVAAATLSHRYISDRFLPDKAIDLIDEAASKLRIEIDSMPEELDIVEKKIKQLEIEKEALKREIK